MITNRSHEKARSAGSSRLSPTRAKSSLFSSPEHKNPFVALAVNKNDELPDDRREKEYPQHIIKFTKIKPNLSYCINPTRTPGYYRSRSEILGTEPPVIVDIMKHFLESAVASVSGADSFGLETLQNSYHVEDMSDEEAEAKKAHERPWMVEESQMETLGELKFIPTAVEEEMKVEEELDVKVDEEDADETKPKKAKKRKIEGEDDEKLEEKKKKKAKKASKKKKLKKRAKKKDKKKDSDDSSDNDKMKEEGSKKKKNKKKNKKKTKSESSSDESSADSGSDAEKPKKKTKKLKKKKSKSKKDSSDSDSDKEEEPKRELKPIDPLAKALSLTETPLQLGEEAKPAEGSELDLTKNESLNFESSLGSSFENFIRSKYDDEVKAGKPGDDQHNWAIEFEEYLRLKFQREKVLKELKDGDRKEESSKKAKKKKKKKQRQMSSESSSSDSSSDSDSKKKRKKRKSKKKRTRSSSSSSSVSENSPRIKLALESDHFYLEGGDGQNLEESKEELKKVQEEQQAPQAQPQPDQVSIAPAAHSALYSPSQMSSTTSSESSDQESSRASSATPSTTNASTPVKDKQFTGDDDGWDIMPKNCISSSSNYTPVITPSMLLYQQSNQISPIKGLAKIEFKTTNLKIKRTVAVHPEFENDDDEMDLESNEAKADKKDAKKLSSPDKDGRRRSSPDRRSHRRSSPNRKSSPGRRSSPSRKSSPRRSSPRRSTPSKRSSPSRKSSPSRRRSPSKGRLSEKRSSPDGRRDKRSPERLKLDDKRKSFVPFRTKSQKKREKRLLRERERNLTPIRLRRSPNPRYRSPDRRKSRSPPRRRSPRARSPPRHRPRAMGKPRTPSPKPSPISLDKRAKIEAELLQEANNSPNSSPLVGLKRSVADSTISDSELQAAAAAAQKADEPDYHDFYEKHYDEYYKDYQTPQRNGQDDEEEEEPAGNSPKRISLDDRIELELGVKKDMPVSQIPVFQFQPGNFGPFFGNHNQFYQQPYDYGLEKPGWRNQEPYQMQPNHSDARVLQVKITPTYVTIYFESCKQNLERPNLFSLTLEP